MQMQSQPIEPTTAPNPLPNGDEDLLRFGGEAFVLKDIQQAHTIAWNRVDFIMRHEGTGRTMRVAYTALDDSRMRAHTALDPFATTEEREILTQIVIKSNADIQQHFWPLAQICLANP